MIILLMEAPVLVQCISTFYCCLVRNTTLVCRSLCRLVSCLSWWQMLRIMKRTKQGFDCVPLGSSSLQVVGLWTSNFIFLLTAFNQTLHVSFIQLFSEKLGKKQMTSCTSSNSKFLDSHLVFSVPSDYFILKPTVLLFSLIHESTLSFHPVTTVFLRSSQIKTV